MVETLSGRWPWETGAMPKSEYSGKTAPAAEQGASLYSLPTVKDRYAENGKRAATVKDLVRLKRARKQGADKYFLW